WKSTRSSTPNAAAAPTARSTSRHAPEVRCTTTTSSAAVCDSTSTTASVTRLRACSVKNAASPTAGIVSRYAHCVTKTGAKGILKIRKIDHVAVCVADIDEAAARWREVLGLQLDAGQREVVESQQTEAALLPIGDT